MQNEFFKSILVVDDDLSNSQVIQDFLVRKGYCCQIAWDFGQAMIQLGQQHFDLVISDIVMGKKDGMALMQEGRELHPHLEFMIMTGHGDTYSYSDIIAAGAMDYLTKPFSLKDLLARLERIRWQKWTEAELKRHQDRLEELVKERTALMQVEIIERQRAEEAHKAADHKYREIFESSPIGIYQSTPTGNYITSNKAFASILGYDSPEELTDSVSNIAEQVYANPHDRQECLRSLSETEAETFELQVKQKDGSTVWVSNHVRVVRDHEGRVIYYEGVIQDITKRKKAEAKVREHVLFLETLFDTIPSPVLHKNVSGCYTGCNRAFLEFTGKSMEEVLGKTVYDMVPKDTADKCTEKDRELLEHPGKQRYELQVQNAQGELRRVVFDKATLVDAQGAVTGLIGVVSDLTEHKQAEDDLRAHEERLRLAMEATQQGWFDLNVQTGEAMVSPEYAKIIGYEPGEFSSSLEEWIDGIHPEDRGAVLESYKECLETGETRTGEYRRLTKTGDWKWIRSIGKIVGFDSEGRPLRMTGTHADISERKRAEDALRESQQQLADIINLLPDATLVVDKEGKVIAWNRAMEAMTGVMKTDMLGKRNEAFSVPFYGQARPMMVDLVLRGDAELLQSFGHIEWKGSTFFTEEYVPGIYQGTGGYVWVTASPLCDRQGNLIGAIESFRDITERKKMEAALMQREKDLEARSFELEETNTALKVLLKRREEDQKEFGVHVLSNLKELVFPYVEKLKNSRLNEIQNTYLGILESHLKEISSPFLRRLSGEFSNLSPMELQIATLIKEGRQNKEIAKMLGVSVNTVLTHRYHLRTKLGVKNKDINLRSYLKSIDT